MFKINMETMLQQGITSTKWEAQSQASFRSGAANFLAELHKEEYQSRLLDAFRSAIS